LKARPEGLASEGQGCGIFGVGDDPSVLSCSEARRIQSTRCRRSVLGKSLRYEAGSVSEPPPAPAAASAGERTGARKTFRTGHPGPADPSLSISAQSRIMARSSSARPTAQGWQESRVRPTGLHGQRGVTPL